MERERFTHDDRNEWQEFITSLTPEETDVLAEMLMRSLRGSWNSPRRRTHILEVIADSGELAEYDRENLKTSVERYFTQIGRGSPDGRVWRSVYSDSDVSVTQLPRGRVEQFASRIPDDLTWDAHRIRTEFSDD